MDKRWVLKITFSRAWTWFSPCGMICTTMLALYYWSRPPLNALFLSVEMCWITYNLLVVTPVCSMLEQHLYRLEATRLRELESLITLIKTLPPISASRVPQATSQSTRLFGVTFNGQMERESFGWSLGHKATRRCLRYTISLTTILSFSSVTQAALLLTKCRN